MPIIYLMPERTSSVDTDFAKRILAYDEYSGPESLVSLLAYRISQTRFGGSPVDNWLKAEEIFLRIIQRKLEASRENT